MSDPWKDSLAAFFTDRAESINAVPTLEDLCFISGRDPRIWNNREVYGDLITSIVDSLQLTESRSVIEVGCASGFLALGVAPRVRAYTGVDVAEGALSVARRLGLPNATLKLTDGARLPWPDDTFDAAFCYDVFTNFPSFADGAGIISEMLRVVKPGGRAMVGSLPDRSAQAAFNERAVAIAESITARFGPPLPPRTAGPPTLGTRVKRLLRKPVTPGVVCYDFLREDFVAHGRALGAAVEVTDIHALNPYVGYRFNVIYTKPE